MKTWHIHIEGIVQGVGFRPFVYKAAKAQDLSGWVNNGVDGVHIRINADELKAQAFKRHILDNPPLLARITSHSIKEISFEEFNDFDIIESTEQGWPNLLITPDYAICPDCENELFLRGDRRFKYPFITCTTAGQGIQL